MFKQAVSSYDAKNPAAKPLATTSAKQTSIQSTYKSNQPLQLGVRQPPGPFGGSTIHNNTNPPYQTPSHVEGSRRRLGDDISATLNNTSQSFQENVQPAMSFETSISQSGTEALHQAVYFEIDDFDDDGDLDFDSEPFIPPKLAAAAASLPSPKPSAPPPQQKPPTASSAFQHFEAPLPQSMDIPSSAPLPWSSSPVEHFAAKPAERVSSRPAENRPSVEGSKPAQHSPPPAPTSKRRKLPWNSERTAPAAPKVARREISTKTTTTTAKTTVPWAGLASAQMPAARTEQRLKRAANVARTSATSDLMEQDGGARLTKSSNIRPARVFLSDEQKVVVKLVTESKQSVFFTGAAGTGKSVLLREVIATLKRQYRKDHDAVAVTASTGLAACNIAGVTLHSFAGIGLGKEPVPDLVRKIRRNAKAKNRWMRTKILIIDEISMVDGDLFDKLEAIARSIRNSGQPFGGIQLVITGDFFQLPPVPENGKPATFAFDAKTWQTCIAHTIGLTHVFRQRDPEFAAMLNEMRLGFLSQNTVETFKKLQRPLSFDDGISATELFSTRREVDRSNTTKMRSLPGESVVFTAEDSGTVHDKQVRDKLLSSCMAPASIELKVNAQVMLIKNYDETLVNGSLGRVIGFMNEKMYDIYDKNGDLDIAADSRSGPLSKRQEKIRDLARDGGGPTDTARRWPLVSFSLADGTSRQLLVQQEEWKVELPNGEIQAQRRQIPLILAWALSIHKAQGQTLERVRVDLGQAFEKGQAYVALSRATCKEGLQVLGFQATKVMAHEKVREFYRNLSGAQEAHETMKKALVGEKQRKKTKMQNMLTGKAKRKVVDGEDEYPGSDEF